MIRTAPIRFTPHIERWEQLLLALGCTFVADQPGWKVARAGRVVDVKSNFVNDVWNYLEHKESRGNQKAVSPKGAYGVGQLMPATAVQVARELGDVPRRERGPICATEVDIVPNAPRALWAAIMPTVSGVVRSVDDKFGKLVPVESLGRDA